MAFELIPFLCGACWYFCRRNGVLGALCGSLGIGVAAAAIAGELSLALPTAALAVSADSTAAAAGWLSARLMTRFYAAR